MFKSIQHFTGTDPDPGVPIADILPLSRRAYALMIRNRKKPLLDEAFLSIAGAIEMLSGLEYHHDNIARLSAALAAGAVVDEADIFHEAVAYVNRMGQLYYFAKSDLVVRATGNALASIPTIQKYIVFRNKHSAHRSIDSPRAESDHEQLTQAMSLSRTWGRMMTLKPGAQEVAWPRSVKAGSPEAQAFHRHEWSSRYITFQLYDADREAFVNFTMQLEHEQICREAYEVLSNVVTWEPERSV